MFKWGMYKLDRSRLPRKDWDFFKYPGGTRYTYLRYKTTVIWIARGTNKS